MIEGTGTQAMLEEYCQYLNQEEKSTATVQKYIRDIRKFFVFADGQEISKELVIAYKSYLIKMQYAVRSINSMLVSLNRFLEYFGRSDCRVKSIRQQRQIYCSEEKELTKEEYLRLLEAAKEKHQLRLVMETICGTGIRVSELQYFTVEMVAKGEINVVCKGKNRRILLPGKLKKKLADYARKQGIQSGPIFITRNGKTLDRSSARLTRHLTAYGIIPPHLLCRERR